MGGLGSRPQGRQVRGPFLGVYRDDPHPWRSFSERHNAITDHYDLPVGMTLWRQIDNTPQITLQGTDRRTPQRVISLRLREAIRLPPTNAAWARSGTTSLESSLGPCTQ